MTTRSPLGYIGPKLLVQGRLTGTGEMQIDGKLQGNLDVDGELRIGASGIVVAAVAASTLRVAGHVRGHVHAEHEVAIHEGGLIEGDVRAPCVTIDDGGTLHGGIVMDFELPDDLREEER